MRFFLTSRFWKRLAIVLAALVAIALIVNGVFAWRAEWRLRSRLAAIRAAGDPASIAELAPKSIPDEENAAAIVERIRPRLVEFGKDYGQFYNSPFGKKYDEARERGEPATREQIDGIRVILSKYPDVEQGIAEAAHCDQYASRMDFSLGHTEFIEQMLDRVQIARTATRFLGWRNEVLLAEGKQEAAMERGIQALRLARLHEHEPTMVAALVAIAMRGIASEQLYDALAAGPISPELHAALDKELARQDDPQRLVRVLKTERAVSADWVYGHLGREHRVLANVIGWPMKSFQIGVLDVTGEYTLLAERPLHEVRERFGLVDSPSSSTGHGVMADLLMPAVKAVFQAHARSLALSRALRIDNALRAFAEKHGREAKGLEEIELPKEATIDPYTGEPLKLKLTDEGWVIYSVMTNGVDDGGDFKGHKDYGVAPRSHRSTE